MRIFKFRFWDVERSKMVYSNEISFKGFSTVYEAFNSDKFKVMQSTELTINDEDIYEGDLLEIKKGGYTFIGVVKYEDGAWWVCDKESSYMNYLIDIYLSEEISFDVIGNIFEDVKFKKMKRVSSKAKELANRYEKRILKMLENEGLELREDWLYCLESDETIKYLKFDNLLYNKVTFKVCDEKGIDKGYLIDFKFDSIKLFNIKKVE